MEEGTIDNILQDILSRRNWYKGTGLSRYNASIFKSKYQQGTASQNRKRDILIKLGYEIKKEIWIKKKTQTT